MTNTELSEDDFSSKELIELVEETRQRSKREQYAAGIFNSVLAVVTIGLAGLLFWLIHDHRSLEAKHQKLESGLVEASRQLSEQQRLLNQLSSDLAGAKDALQQVKADEDSIKQALRLEFKQQLTKYERKEDFEHAFKSVEKISQTDPVIRKNVFDARLASFEKVDEKDPVIRKNVLDARLGSFEKVDEKDPVIRKNVLDARLGSFERVDDKDPVIRKNVLDARLGSFEKVDDKDPVIRKNVLDARLGSFEKVDDKDPVIRKDVLDKRLGQYAKRDDLAPSAFKSH